MSDETIELEVDRISQLGEGVAHFEGRSVFIPKALPGERVRIRWVESSKALRGEIVEVLRPSPSRRQPICSLADVCGGCDWLHAEETLQLQAKQEIALSTLEHLGGIKRDAIDVHPIKTSEKTMGYRRRAVLHMAHGRLGFYSAKSRQLVPVNECPALVPALASLPGRLAEFLSEIEKDISNVTLLAEHKQVSVGFELSGALKPKTREWINKALARLSLAGGLIVAKDGSVEPIGKPVIKSMNLSLPEQPLYHRPDAFLQANAEGNDLLVDSALRMLNPKAEDHILELYCGNGNFTFPIASHVTDILAVENASVSIQLAQRSAREGALRNVRFIQGDVAKVCDGLMKEGRKFQALFLDPPRVGAIGVGKWALGMEIQRVVYVSCDVGSLARDAAELTKAGYSAKELQLVDMFPQTRHIEAVMSFEREPSKPRA